MAMPETQHFTYDRHLGGGSTAVVYQARDRTNDRRCVIKSFFSFVKADSVAAEAEVQLRVHHPHVLEIWATGPSYLVLEPALGSLADVLLRGQPVPLNVTHQWLQELLTTLAHIHQLGIVHCDLKPDNLLFSEQGMLKIGDWGGARAVSGALGSVTYAYCPPEVLLGDERATPAMDVWAAGCVAAKILTGQSLFPGETRGSVLSRIEEQLGRASGRDGAAPSPRPFTGLAVSPEYVVWLTGVLQLEPQQRWTAAQALAHLPPAL